MFFVKERHPFKVHGNVYDSERFWAIGRAYCVAWV